MGDERLAASDRFKSPLRNQDCSIDPGPRYWFWGRLTRIGLMLFAATFVVGPLLGGIAISLHPRLLGAILFFGLFAYFLSTILTLAVAYLLFLFSRCPLCKHGLHTAWYGTWPFSEQCIHCGAKIVKAPTDAY